MIADQTLAAPPPTEKGKRPMTFALGMMRSQYAWFAAEKQAAICPYSIKD
jgi:hypothetical protein